MVGAALRMLALYFIICCMGLANLIEGLVVFFRTGIKPGFRQRIKDTLSFIRSV